MLMQLLFHISEVLFARYLPDMAAVGRQSVLERDMVFILAMVDVFAIFMYSGPIVPVIMHLLRRILGTSSLDVPIVPALSALGIEAGIPRAFGLLIVVLTIPADCVRSVGITCTIVGFHDPLPKANASSFATSSTSESYLNRDILRHRL